MLVRSKLEYRIPNQPNLEEENCKKEKQLTKNIKKTTRVNKPNL